MTVYLLNAAYLLLLLLAAPWFFYQRLFRGKYREGFASKFWGAVPLRQSHQPCIWLHAVSVGEVNLLAVLLKEITNRRPDVECVISTTTMTGFALARQKYNQVTVFYCPLDFSWAVRRAMRRIRPALVLLAELELWPNLVRAAKEHGATVAIVNGRLSEHSFRGYRRARRWIKPVLERLDIIAVQNAEYAERFCGLGIDSARVQVTGSLKFDGAQTDRNNARTQSLREVAGFRHDDIIFLAGSTQDPEEKLALDTFQSLSQQHPRLRLILVPRHPHRFSDVAELLDKRGVRWQRRSQLVFGASDQRIPNSNPLVPLSCVNASPRILLVDTVGELGAWWGMATIGFVGGSLFSSRGGQNMIEPAAYGVAACFGPNTQNFRDVVAMLLQSQAAVRVNNGEELTAFVGRCLEEEDTQKRGNSSFAIGIGQRAAALVKQQQGATVRTWTLLEPLLPQPRQLPRTPTAHRPAA